MSTPPPKRCAVCARLIRWRKKWERDWDEVRYCSKRCRGARLGETDQRLERAILDLLEGRARGASICPSEAARAVDPQGWAELMERTRWAANRLVARGRVRMLQRGRPVEPSTARGPVRLSG